MIADLRLSLKYLQGSIHTIHSSWSLSGLISLSSAKHRPSSQVISWYLNLGKNSSSTTSEKNIVIEKAWKNQPTNWIDDVDNIDTYVASQHFNCDFHDSYLDSNRFQFHVKIKEQNDEIPIVGPSMLDAMKNMFLDGKMSDIKIQCEDQEFPCHKNIRQI